MQWWQDFPGWVITTVLAAAAAFTGAWVIWRYHKDRPTVEWVEKRDPSGAVWFVTLINVGDAAAIHVRVKGIGCSIVASPDNAAVFYRIEPGGSLQVGLQVDSVPEGSAGRTAQDMVNRAMIRATYLTAPVKYRIRQAVTLQLLNGDIRVDKLPSKEKSPAA